MHPSPNLSITPSCTTCCSYPRSIIAFLFPYFVSQCPSLYRPHLPSLFLFPFLVAVILSLPSLLLPLLIIITSSLTPTPTITNFFFPSFSISKCLHSLLSLSFVCHYFPPFLLSFPPLLKILRPCRHPPSFSCTHLFVHGAILRRDGGSPMVIVDATASSHLLWIDIVVVVFV